MTIITITKNPKEYIMTVDIPAVPSFVISTEDRSIAFDIGVKLTGFAVARHDSDDLVSLAKEINRKVAIQNLTTRLLEFAYIYEVLPLYTRWQKGNEAESEEVEAAIQALTELLEDYSEEDYEHRERAGDLAEELDAYL
jgi:hypothetical protein